MIKAVFKLPSTELMRPVEVQVALPYRITLPPGPSRLLVALHCAMSDASFFLERSELCRMVDEENLILVAPSLGNGYFIDSDYERQSAFLRDEFLPFIAACLPVSAKRDDRFLLGVSMGGFGALKLAMDKRDEFRSVAAISGNLNPLMAYDAMAPYPTRAGRMFDSIFWKHAVRLMSDDKGRVRPENDIATRLEREVRDSKLPTLHLRCGENDWAPARHGAAIAEICRRAGIRCSFIVEPGGHNEEYWRDSIPQTVSAMLRDGDDRARDSEPG